MAAPETLASVTELSDWIGEPIAEGSVEGKRAVLCLRLASALVRDESGQTWTDSTGALEDIPENARLVTLYCSSRVFDNREARTRGGVDDWSESLKVDEAGAYLTVSEKRMLSGLRAGASFGGLGTVSTTRISGPVRPYGWVPTDTPNVFFPWY